MTHPPTKSPKLSQNRHTLDWNHIKLFYQVTQAGSFSEAAKRLNNSQPDFSRHIRSLEQRLGETLFTRTHTGVTLTRAGQVAFEVARQSFHQIEVLKARILEDRQGPQGKIRVHASPDFIARHLRPHIPGFQMMYPDIHLAITASTQTPVLGLGWGEVDVALYPPLGRRQGWTQIPLIRTPIKLYASQKYLTDAGTPHTAQDLDDHALIASTDGPDNPINWHLTLGATSGHPRVPLIEVDMPDERLNLAAQGWGIAAVLADDPGLEHHDLIEVLPHVQPPALEYCYIHNVHPLKRVQLLGDYLAKCFTGD